MPCKTGATVNVSTEPTKSRKFQRMSHNKIIKAVTIYSITAQCCAIYRKVGEKTLNEAARSNGNTDNVMQFESWVLLLLITAFVRRSPFSRSGLFHTGPHSTFSTQKITHRQQLPLDQQYHRQFKLDDASIKNKVARNGLDCLVIFLEITSRHYLDGI